MMKPILILLVCISVLGCRKKKVEQNAALPPAKETTPAGEASVSAKPAVIPAASVRPAGSHPGEPASANEVRVAYHQYFEKVGNFPNGWQDMIKRKFLPAVPQGKNGQPLDFVQFTLWEAGRPAK